MVRLPIRDAPHIEWNFHPASSLDALAYIVVLVLCCRQRRNVTSQACRSAGRGFALFVSRPRRPGR